jgi:methionine synthase II (cobalamin-independent)
MTIQYGEGLPLLELREEKRCLVISEKADREADLIAFYERFFAGDTAAFAMSEERAPGLHAMVGLLSRQPAQDGRYIKGQTVGPVTFAASILNTDGRPALYDSELLEALSRGLAIKALWQIRALENSKRTPVIFLDEPSLSGFGSAFTPMQRQDVIDALQTVIGYLKEHARVLVGIHCCGNTDWAMLLEAGADIINFDAFGYMDTFLLYPNEIKAFLRRGGVLAWGIVPTLAFTGNERVEELTERLQVGIQALVRWGVEPAVLSERSMLTPACGMGTMDPAAARAALSLLSDLSRRCLQRF